MKSLSIFALVLVAFVAFSSPSPSWAQAPNVCTQISFGKVLEYDERTLTAIVKMDNPRGPLGKRVTLDFRHSHVGMCGGAMPNPAVAALPHVGDSVVFRQSECGDTCEECLALC